MAKDETKKIEKKGTKKAKSDVSEIKEKVTKKTDTKLKSTKNSKKETENKTTKKDTTKSLKTTKKSTTSKTKNTSSTNQIAKSAKKTSKTKQNSKSTVKSMLAEYYDLPYRYNQTIVKILAQTPTTLFVYWDISDEDRNNLINQYGEHFFYETRPVLVLHNTTKNYTFEIEINDFANSWYIRTQEPNCDYIIELGRRFNRVSNEYIYINSSNDIISPNDHILFENLNLKNVLFKNIKTNNVSSKDFGNLQFSHNINNLYGNIYDIYNVLYKDELLNEITGPSSGEFYLKK